MMTIREVEFNKALGKRRMFLRQSKRMSQDTLGVYIEARGQQVHSC